MIRVRGSIDIHAIFEVVGDIREYVKYLDKMGIPDDTKVLDGYCDISILGAVEPIECGEHFPSEGSKYDYLVLSHAHDDASDMMEPLGYSEAKLEGKV
jgi:hypothetical protein